MRIYLDNCCYNRPFDDQKQVRVRLETEAKLHIQDQVRSGTLELGWSYMLDLENTRNPFQERGATIGEWRRCAAIDVEETATILDEAHALVGAGLKAKDSLHVACAIAAGCKYFVTTDDEILKRAKDVQAIRVVDPPTLVREMNL